MKRNLNAYAPAVNEQRRQKLLGKKSPNWKGNSANYTQKHLWLRQHHKKSGKCALCKRVRATEWALKKGKKYSRRIEDYFELCVPCHRSYDKVIKKMQRTKRRQALLNNK